MKKLSFISKIIFNIFLINFIFIMAASIFCSSYEGMITDNIFGGYKSEIVSSDDTDSTYYESSYGNLENLIAANKNLCIAAEAEGAVLIKNDNNALPMSSDSKISLFGMTSADPMYGMWGTSAAAISIAEDDKLDFGDGFKDAGFEINQEVFDFYDSQDANKRVTKGHGSYSDFAWESVDADSKADGTYSDAAVYVISRDSAEGADKWGSFLALSSNEQSMLANLKAQKDAGKFDKIIVVINSSLQIDTGFIDDASYGIDSVLWTGGLGVTGVRAVPSLMTGATTPSGHLSDAWFTTSGVNPADKNYGSFSHDTANYLVYAEGIYLGYKYGETRYEDTVLGQGNTEGFVYSDHIGYPFGYGLSYAEFDYSDYEISYNSADDTYKASVTVTNTSKTYSGKDVVQMYVQKPYSAYDVTNHIEKASVELVGFEKTSKLAPGEDETVTMTIKGSDFASYDAWGAGTYVLGTGDYYLTAAQDSHDAVNNILAAKGKTTADGMDANGDASLATVALTVKTLDDETYSVSASTGNEVGNLFDHADLNRYNDGVNSVTYLSRNDWTGTYPSSATVVKTSAKIEADHNYDLNANLETDKEAYPTYGVPAGVDEDGNPTNLNLITMRVDADGNKIAYTDELWDTFMDQLTWDDTVTLLSNGYRQTVALESVAKPATIDHNGTNGFKQKYSHKSTGLATTTGDALSDEYCTGWVTLDVIASSFNKSLAYAVGAATGEDSLWSGQAGIYGFGFNIHRSSRHGRRAEYYSEDTYLTGVMGGWESLGANSKGLYVYNKHFALNEQEVNRYAVETWASEQAIRETYLKGWAVALDIVEDREMSVMTSFNRIGAIWSGADENLLTGWLREEQGMVGIAVSDYTMPDYMGYVNGVLAGNDLPDGNSSYIKTDFQACATEHGEVAQSMRESAKRVLYTVCHSNAMNGITASSKIIVYEPEWISVFANIELICIILFGASAVFAGTMIVLGIINKKKVA